MVASRYTSIIESMATGIEGLPVDGYRETDSDGWSQNQRINIGDLTAHLQFAVWLGSSADRAAHATQIAGEIRFGTRYNPDTDSVSQANAHAAAEHLTAYIEDWSDATGARVLDVAGYDIAPIGADWFGCTVTFTLHLPRF